MTMVFFLSTCLSTTVSVPLKASKDILMRVYRRPYVYLQKPEFSILGGQTWCGTMTLATAWDDRPGVRTQPFTRSTKSSARSSITSIGTGLQ